MSRSGKTAVNRARQTVGSRFRPQGRSREFGLDCIGLAAVAYGLPATAVPCDYRLRGEYLCILLEGLDIHFRLIPTARAKPGDMLLCAIAPDQHHLVIKTGDGFIHAHARHGVIETPGDPPWPLLGAFRRRTR